MAITAEEPIAEQARPMKKKAARRFQRLLDDRFRAERERDELRQVCDELREENGRLREESRLARKRFAEFVLRGGNKA